MNIKPFISPEEKERIAKLLEEMFVCQDRKKTKEEIVLLTNELSSCNYSFSQIADGVNSLKSKVYQSIKLRDIKNAIEDRQGEKQFTERVACKYCVGTGVVCLKTPEKSSYAFRCACDNGDKPCNQRFPLWLGGEKMTLNDIEYTYPFWGIMQLPPKDISGYNIEKSQPKEEEIPF